MVSRGGAERANEGPMVQVFMGLQRVGRSGGGEGEKLPDVSAAP